jgi:hypothetical protein
LRVEKTGFATRLQSRVIVGVAEAVKVDFGMNAGANVNLVTKSGARDLQGSL